MLVEELGIDDLHLSSCMEGLAETIGRAQVFDEGSAGKGRLVVKKRGDEIFFPPFRDPLTS